MQMMAYSGLQITYSLDTSALYATMLRRGFSPVMASSWSLAVQNWWLATNELVARDNTWLLGYYIENYTNYDVFWYFFAKAQMLAPYSYALAGDYVVVYNIFGTRLTTIALPKQALAALPPVLATTLPSRTSTALQQYALLAVYRGKLYRIGGSSATYPNNGKPLFGLSVQDSTGNVVGKQVPGLPAYWTDDGWQCRAVLYLSPWTTDPFGWSTVYTQQDRYVYILHKQISTVDKDIPQLDPYIYTTRVRNPESSVPDYYSYYQLIVLDLATESVILTIRWLPVAVSDVIPIGQYLYYFSYMQPDKYIKLIKIDRTTGKWVAIETSFDDFVPSLNGLSSVWTADPNKYELVNYIDIRMTGVGNQLHGKLISRVGYTGATGTGRGIYAECNFKFDVTTLKCTTMWSAGGVGVAWSLSMWYTTLSTTDSLGQLDSTIQSGIRYPIKSYKGLLITADLYWETGTESGYLEIRAEHLTNGYSADILQAAVATGGISSDIVGILAHLPRSMAIDNDTIYLDYVTETEFAVESVTYTIKLNDVLDYTEPLSLLHRAAVETFYGPPRSVQYLVAVDTIAMAPTRDKTVIAALERNSTAAPQQTVYALYKRNGLAGRKLTI